MSGTDLYRFYDADDRLLYIGISLHAAMRASQHKADKHWWPDVDRMTVDHLQADRTEAHAIERLAILDEKPIYNVTHNAQVAISDTDDGVVEFDATRIVDVYASEVYQEVGRAMDVIAHRCDDANRAGHDVGTRLEFVQILGALARSLVYGDCCKKCFEIRYPLALRRESPTWVRCGYWCTACNEQWSCGWTTDLAILAVI